MIAFPHHAGGGAGFVVTGVSYAIRRNFSMLVSILLSGDVPCCAAYA
ncbi:MAG: hypothetical protein AVDCRST_MAG26-954 [uncultured Chloroflexia bacterium]|uniref:Uncharacterized protein n=1 Tax=uncultured Chloroflexia bacterium TaxID=1672391 RepID=A0A6J4HRG1_9CHLR|nr:MAG: hypothetical protein AVDCRST_MAG26-954 [uncultured Chloroflexia bacterium]